MSSDRRDASGYQPVSGSEDAPLPISQPRSLGSALLISITAVLSLSVGLVLGAAGFSTSRSTFASCPVVTLQQPASAAGPRPDVTLGAVEKPFKYNRTFGEDPRGNKATVEAWESIVPRQLTSSFLSPFLPSPSSSPLSKRYPGKLTGMMQALVGQGSVRFPANSPHVYTLSVVHQLHCLWSIHGSYYSGSGSDSKSDSRDGIKSAHMRHCFDYLRQSLMCASDVSLEPVDPKLGGVTGWGNVRVCRDYDQVRAWAEKNRVNNLRGFLQAPASHHHGQ